MLRSDWSRRPLTILKAPGLLAQSRIYGEPGPRTMHTGRRFAHRTKLTIHPALHAAVFACKALRTQRPNALCRSCQVHGAEGGDDWKQSCTACDAIWQCCSACFATFARSEPEKRGNRSMDSCRATRSGGRVRIPVGKPDKDWQDVLLPLRFNTGPH